jgi:branched-chain amino acid transport system substrate-binding protein
MASIPGRAEVAAAIVAIVLCFLPKPGAAQPGGAELKIGGLFDLSGITADVGRPYAQGVKDHIAYVNANGGINGKRIRLLDVDYGYKIPEAIAAYKRLVTDEKVLLISGWGTGDTEALKEAVTKDKVPYLSASFSATLTNPQKTPYNFFVAPTYSDQLRAWLTWVKEDWKDRSRAPKIAALYGDNPYGRAPMEAGKLYAKELGIEWVFDGVLPGGFQDATSQLLTMQRAGADYAYINVTTTGVAIILKDAKRLGLKTKFGSNPYGFSESLVAVARGDAEGVTGVMPHAPYGAAVPGMDAILKVNKGRRSGEGLETMYVRGWASAMVIMESLRRADTAGELNGEGIRKALETLRNFDLGGLAAPVTYTATDHRPSTTTPIYVVRGGKLEKLKDYEMPRKPEWLGL